MDTKKLSVTLGVVLIVVGIFIPSSKLIAFLRTVPADLQEQLLLGATLCKIGLVILGLSTIAVGRMSFWKPALQGEQPLTDYHRQSSFIILVVILVIAAALRLYWLGAGLWYDEILTYVRYVKLPVGEIISTYDSQNQHSLYTLLAHASLWVFGESTWSLRLPAALFGIGSIWALDLLGRQVSNAQEALFSAALLTFSYPHIWFSQNARGYSGLLFWTILASWLLLRALREARPHLWLWYAIAASLGMYTHTTMVFVIIGHLIIYLMTLYTRRQEIWPDRWTGLFLGFGLLGVFTFQLYALVLPQIFGTALWEVSTVPAWTHPLWALLEFITALKISFAGGVVATIAFLVFALGFVNFAYRQPVVIWLLMIPASLCAVVIVAMGHHLWPRFFFFTMGFAALVTVRGTLLVGDGIARLLPVSFARSVPLGAALCLGLIFVSALSMPVAYGPKQDYQGALAFVAAEREPGDAVVTVGLATYPYQSFYQVDWEKVDTVDALNAIRSRAKRTWVLYTFPFHLRGVYPDITANLQRDFTVVRQFAGTVNDGAIFVCRSDHPGWK